jgi:fructose-1,6-bisphosphatase I
MLKDIFKAIEKSGLEISKIINRDSFEYSNNHNSSGENQLKLDIESDLIIENNFKMLKQVKEISSEEKKDSLVINPDGEFLISYDPLDGSSLVNVNLSVGSIFGIYKDKFQGNDLIASAYIVYGPRVELVIAEKNTDEVKLYRLQNSEFKFIKNIELKNQGNLNAPGGTQNQWFEYHKNLVEKLFSEGYRLRYSGGMVPDLHQILLKGGGLFSYPGTKDKEKGKLRLLFEVLPFALIYEKAGGSAINNKLERLLEIVPENLHDTSPCFFGSKYEIDLMKKYYG